MARHLYRLGRASFRNRRLVLVTWVVVFVGAIAGATTLSGQTQDSFDLPGLESTDAFTVIEERDPGATPDGATARIVYHAPAGETVTSSAAQQVIDDSLAEVSSPHVARVSSPFDTGAVSEDERTAYATVSYTTNAIELTEADRDALEAATGPAEAAGLEVAIGGDALQEVPHMSAAELIGIALAAVILVITFGSLVAAGMPLLTAVIGTGTGVMGITLATGFMDLGSTTPILASMLGLAVSIDYALFIVSRYRHEVASGRSLEDAAGRAVGTAGSAVVFAGLTVAIALAGLSVVGIRFLTEMGLAAVVTVGLAVLTALTLLPAILGFAGERIMSSRWAFLRSRDPERRPEGTVGNGRRWVGFVTRRKGTVLALGTLFAAVLAIPVASMQLSLPDDGTQPDGSDKRVAFDLISESFGAGANGPLLVVVDTADAASPESAVQQFTSAVTGIETEVASVIPAAPAPVPEDASADAVAAYDDRLAAYQESLAETDLATITVIPTTGPSDAATAELVRELRSALDPVEAATGATSYVSGQTAVGVDVSQKLADVFPVYLALVVGLAFVLLVVLFRSILVPLKAVLGFIITIGISLGATVAVFQWGWLAGLVGVDQPGPLLAMLPILLVGILFGLAMDYEVFLVSRMREEYVHGRAAADAVSTGFAHGARVVTAAALIMIGVFAAFATSGDIIIVTIAFGLAVGILADAFLVRMTLVPAVMALAGDRMWWLPAWLDRLLPDLDVEGESLDPHRESESTKVLEVSSR